MGPRQSQIVAAIFFGPMALGMLMIVILPAIFRNYVQLSIAGLLIGTALLIIAKASVMKKGTLFSFGTALMTPKMQKFYYTGYGIFIASAMLAVSLHTIDSPKNHNQDNQCQTDFSTENH